MNDFQFRVYAVKTNVKPTKQKEHETNSYDLAGFHFASCRSQRTGKESGKGYGCGSWGRPLPKVRFAGVRQYVQLLE